MCFSTSRTHTHLQPPCFQDGVSRHVGRSSPHEPHHVNGLPVLGVVALDAELVGEEVEVRLEVEDEDEARQVEAEPQLDRQLREGEALGRRRRQQLAELG